MADEGTVVLVTGESRTGLACSRSLSRAEIPFVVLSDDRGLLASSRFVARHAVGPRASECEADMFMEAVLTLVERYGATAILPTYDNALRVLDRHREALGARAVTLVAASSDAVRNVLDKGSNLETARRLGIPCPAQFELLDLSQLPDLLDALRFPIVLKPRESGGGGANPSSFKWLVAHDERELRQLIAEHCVKGHFPLFQERVAGEMVNLYCVAVSGKLIGVLGQRSPRRMFGENVYREIVPAPADLLSHAEALLGDLRWDGFASVAFFVSDSGEAKYMETNARMWGGVGGHVRIGWDFPTWAVRFHRDGVVPSLPPVRLGARSCWRFADLMRIVAIARGEAWMTDVEDATLLRAALDYFSAFQPGVASDVFELGDPRPEFVEHWRWIREARLRSFHRAVRVARARRV